MAYDFKSLEEKLSKAKEWLSMEYRGLRSGRATPAILDGIRVTAYGSLMPLNQLGTIRVDGARSLVIQPYDTSVLKDIERAIAEADLGLGVGSDPSGVRVTFPELSAERREQFVKLAKQKLEEARTSVRLARDEAWKELQEKEKSNEITEDDKFILKDKLQEKVDACNEDLEKSFEAKEKEMSS
jgi:ribosome recycling factor